MERRRPQIPTLQLPADSSSSSESDLHPRRRRDSGSLANSGGRIRQSSFSSHSFPSFLTGKKKKRKRHGKTLGTETGSDSSSSDGITGEMSHLGMKDQAQTEAGTRESMVTGACMTCGSLVRWPKEKTIFRCSICLTINDVERADGGSGKPSRSPAEVEPLSLAHTQSLVKQCLEAYLRAATPHGPALGGTVTTQAEAKTVRHDYSLLPTFTVAPPGISGKESQGREATSMHNVSLPPRGRDDRTRALLGGHAQKNTLSGTGRAAPSYANADPSSRSKGRATERRSSLSSDYPAPRASEPHSKHIFQALEDYLVDAVKVESLNASFVAPRNASVSVIGKEGHRRLPSHGRREPEPSEWPVADVDAKLLLLGDFAENGSWWTGGGQHESSTASRSASRRTEDMRSPRIDWAAVDKWYDAIVYADKSWTEVYRELQSTGICGAIPDERLRMIEGQILAGRACLQEVLLKATERMLRRPGRRTSNLYELRFPLIAMANPLLQPGFVSSSQSSIVKRLVGLLSNLSSECHRQLTHWLARLPSARFSRMKDLVHGFLVYRLLRHREKRASRQTDVVGGLVPSVTAGRSPASLHAALGHASAAHRMSVDSRSQKTRTYQEDWQVRAAVRVLALLFAANIHVRAGRSSTSSVVLNNHPQAQHGGLAPTAPHVLPISDFYVALLDDSDLVADFETWEQKRATFSFCQYPFLLSIGAKIQILEHDAQRQMHTRARDAFFDSIMNHRAVDQHLTLHVRRDCLVEDSLRAVGEVIGSGGEDIKKGLRIVFTGEEGIDAGGLRKEWFLLLVREVFHPDHGMFVYDEDSRYCYFNPNSWETSDQFFLVGVVFGLAMYNSAILDAALPPFAFRKLLSAAPPPTASANGTASSTQQRPPPPACTLEDLAEFRPQLARGLRQLLEFEGDVEATFALNFVIELDKYGAREQVPLCAGGQDKSVTSSNRREYVDLYVRYFLDTSVARQFEPFKRGFFAVCGGNALSLFRAEEIELLVRGSDEALDVDALRGAATYENWGAEDPTRTEATVQWFWQAFEDAPPESQRKLLVFVTGSDRIPAMGAASLSIRIACLGDDCGRYPTARTCFNTLSLSRYRSRERLEAMLWRAVYESEGFGLR